MLTLVICTYNRSAILRYCLEALANQTANQNNFEVLVIDNGSTDNTKELVNSFRTRITNLRHVFEKEVGLSHARNRGFQEARFDWVAYLDDDAKAHSNFVERAIYSIEKYNFDFIGGFFFPWYLEPKPKWLSDSFSMFPYVINEVGELQKDHHAIGCVMMMKVIALKDIGGFPVELGMIGNQVGYGEENWVQDEMRKKNYKLGFDPELKVDHLVASYKFTVIWHLKRFYAKGRTDRLMNPVNASIKQFLVISKGTAHVIYALVKNLPKLIFKHNYYRQNYILDCLGLFMRAIGYISV